MKIAIDIDNTITNMNEILLQMCNAHYGTSYTYQDITSYDFFDKTFDNPWRFTNTRQFWDEVDVDKAAVKRIKSRIMLGHHVLLVTASHFNDMLGYKIKTTLAKIGLPDNYLGEKDIIVAQDKRLIPCDIMIDDYAPNLDASCASEKILVDQPWNWNNMTYRRLTSWKNFIW